MNKDIIISLDGYLSNMDDYYYGIYIYVTTVSRLTWFICSNAVSDISLHILEFYLC